MSRLAIDPEDMPDECFRRRVVVPSLAPGPEIGLPHSDAWITEWTRGGEPVGDELCLSGPEVGRVGGFLEARWKDRPRSERAGLWPLRTFCDVQDLVQALVRSGMSSAVAADLRKILASGIGCPASTLAAARVISIPHPDPRRAFMRVDRDVRIQDEGLAAYRVHPVCFVDQTDGIAGAGLRASFLKQAIADGITLAFTLLSKAFSGAIRFEVAPTGRGLDFLRADFERLLHLAALELTLNRDLPSDRIQFIPPAWPSDQRGYLQKGL